MSEISAFALVLAMATPGEVRAARALLGWTRQKLADKAVLSVSAIIRFEQSVVETRQTTHDEISKPLKKAGIEFLSEIESSEGIRLRKKRRSN